MRNANPPAEAPQEKTYRSTYPQDRGEQWWGKWQGAGSKARHCPLRVHDIKRCGMHAARVSGGSPPVIKGGPLSTEGGESVI